MWRIKTFCLQTYWSPYPRVTRGAGHIASCQICPFCLPLIPPAGSLCPLWIPSLRVVGMVGGLQGHNTCPALLGNLPVGHGHRVEVQIHFLWGTRTAQSGGVTPYCPKLKL